MIVENNRLVIFCFNISLGDDYAFSLLRKIKMPVSLNLEQLVNSLFLLGEIIDDDDQFILADASKKIIKTVGNCISKVIHAARYGLSSNIDVNEVCKYTNITENEVKSSLGLVKIIERKLNN